MYLELFIIGNIFEDCSLSYICMYYIFCDNIYMLLGLEISVMMMCFLLLLGFF